MKKLGLIFIALLFLIIAFYLFAPTTLTKTGQQNTNNDASNKKTPIKKQVSNTHKLKKEIPEIYFFCPDSDSSCIFANTIKSLSSSFPNVSFSMANPSNLNSLPFQDKIKYPFKQHFVCFYYPANSIFRYFIPDLNIAESLCEKSLPLFLSQIKSQKDSGLFKALLKVTRIKSSSRLYFLKKGMADAVTAKKVILSAFWDKNISSYQKIVAAELLNELPAEYNKEIELELILNLLLPDEENEELKEKALIGLQLFGSEYCLDYALNYITHKYPRNIRTQAVILAGEFGDKETAKLLSDSYFEENVSEVRVEYLYALEQCPDNIPRKILIEALSDTDPVVKFSASEIIMRSYPDKFFLPFLTKLILDEDEQFPVRHIISHALVLIGGEESIKTLGSLLTSKDNKIRGSAAECLGLLKATEYHDTIMELFKNDPNPFTRALAALGLGFIGNEEDAQIFKLTKDPSDLVMYFSKLGEYLVSEKAPAKLKEILYAKVRTLKTPKNDEEKFMRFYTVKAFGYKKEKEATALLIDSLDIRDIRYSQEILNAINLIWNRTYRLPNLFNKKIDEFKSLLRDNLIEKD